MQFEDTIKVPTPEGLELELSLAGLGSRFSAALLDTLIQLALVYVIPLFLGIGTFLAAGGDDDAGLVFVALWFVWAFLVFFGYDIAFETLAGGRTPGKRALGIRVVRNGGHPVGFLTSAVRNLVRLIDFLPILYATGMVAILVTANNQRLGDLAAGTVVVRDRRPQRRPASAFPPAPLVHGEAGAGSAAWDVSGVSKEELAAVRSFLERRHGFTPEARANLAWQLAQSLRPKVAGHDAGEHPEVFLERVAREKSARS